MLHSQDIKVFIYIFFYNHSLIYQICDVMMNIGTIFLNHNPLSHQTWSIDIDLKKANNFQESIEQFGGERLSSRSFLF